MLRDSVVPLSEVLFRFQGALRALSATFVDMATDQLRQIAMGRTTLIAWTTAPAAGGSSSGHLNSSDLPLRLV